MRASSLILGLVRRRAVLVAMCLAAAVPASSCRSSAWPGAEATREALLALRGEVRGRVLAGDLARADGFACAKAGPLGDR